MFASALHLNDRVEERHRGELTLLDCLEGLRDVRGTGLWWASVGGNVVPHHHLCLDKGLRTAESQG